MAIASGFRSDDTLEIEERVLTALEATNRELTLANVPNPDKLILDIPNGTSQVKGFDFEIVGQVLTWDGYALETLLEAGDRFRILYVKQI